MRNYDDPLLDPHDYDIAPDMASHTDAAIDDLDRMSETQSSFIPSTILSTNTVFCSISVYSRRSLGLCT